MSTSDSESSQVAPASPSNPDDVIQRFVEQQAQEILIRKEELELKKRELEHSYAHAQRILEAQSQDRREIRAHEQTNNKRGARLFFLIRSPSQQRLFGGRNSKGCRSSPRRWYLR